MVQVRVQLVNWILPILLSLFLVSTSCLLSLISPTETPTHIPFLDTPRKRPELATSDHEDQLASTAFSTHQPALIRWSGWWIIAAFLIYVKWYRLLFPTWTDQAGPVPQRRTRGRALASVAAAVHDSSLLSVQSQPTYHFPSIEKDDADHSGAANIGLNAHTRRRCPVVQAPPRWVEDLVPPHAPAKARRSAGSSCIERAKSIPMLRSLYGTPRIRSRYQSLLYKDEELPPRAPIGARPAEVPTPPPTEKLYVFFVGVNQDVEDPEHDVDAFKKIFKQPSIKDPNVRFASVTGVSATRRHIKGWLIWLDLLAASDGSKVLAFLSGSGDVTNRMCLSEGAGHIAENDLCDWLSTARTRLGLSNLKPVTIVFDICREGTNPPRVSRSDVVNLIWSCSLGQRSHAIGFEPPVLPRSCFWLALLRACKDVNPTFSGFEATFRRGLDELGRFVVHNYTVWHAETGFCDFCKEEIGGRCAWPEPQVPLGVQTGWEDLYGLALIIAKSYNDSARMIDAVYREQMELYKLWVDNHTSRATQHIRGAHQPVSQANVQYLPEILSVAG